MNSGIALQIVALAGETLLFSFDWYERWRRKGFSFRENVRAGMFFVAMRMNEPEASFPTKTYAGPRHANQSPFGLGVRNEDRVM